MLPPKSCWMPAPIAPTTLRDRTTMPRTRPRLRTIREPSTVNAVVTHSLCTSGAAAAGYIAIALTPCEFRFLLGKEAHDPDHGILAERRTREVARFDFERGLHGHVQAAVDGVFDQRDGQRRPSRQLAGERVDRRPELIGGHRLVDPAHGFGLGRGKPRRLDEV